MRRHFFASFALIAAFVVVACGGTLDADPTSTTEDYPDGGVVDIGMDTLSNQTSDSANQANNNIAATDAGITTDAETVTDGDTTTEDDATIDAVSVTAVCKATAQQGCLTGLSGICAAGVKTCSDDGTWGACEVQIPRSSIDEICGNGKDDDCDGQTDWEDTEDCGGPVIGQVEEVYYDSEAHQHYVEGWACFKGDNQSIDVNIYVADAVANDAVDNPTPIATGSADLVAEAEIHAAEQCDTPERGAGHRFRIAIPLETGKKIVGKLIVAKGLSPVPAEIAAEDEALGDMSLSSDAQPVIPLPETTAISHGDVDCMLEAWKAETVAESTFMFRDTFLGSLCLERYYSAGFPSSLGIRLAACNSGEKYQKWEVEYLSDDNYHIKGTLDVGLMTTSYKMHCITTNDSGAITVTPSCNPEDPYQQWSFDW